MKRRTNVLLSVLACLIAFGITRAQQPLATPQAPPQKLVILTGEPCQFHIPGNREVWAAQVVRVHADNRADLVVWESAKKTWMEHHRIALDRGPTDKDVFYTLFR